MGRVERAAARDHVDQLEVGEGEEHRKGHDDGDDRRQERQRDVAELLPARRAVDRRGFVVGRRDRLQSGEQGDGDEGHAAPDVGGDHRQARVPRLAEEIDVLVDQAHLHQHPADDGELRVVDPPEGDRRERRRHDVGQQDDGAKEGLEADVAVEEQCEPEAEHELDDARHHRVEDGVEERQARDRVVPEELVVLEADPRAGAPDLGVGEAEPEAEAERIRQEDDQQQRRRQHEQHAQRVAVVLQSFEHANPMAVAKRTRAGRVSPPRGMLAAVA